jgi:flagellar basal-body rod protein FlgF
MQDAISIVTSAMQGDIADANRISTNVANLGTVGYRRTVAGTGAAASHASGVERSFERSLNAAANIAPAGDSGVIDQRTGAMISTSHALDLAVGGAGYFEVMTSHGPAYTRAGDFHVDAQGRLADSAGDPVQGVDGDITLSSNAVKIDLAGHVTDNGRAAGQVKLVSASGSAAVDSIGGGLYSISSVGAAPTASHVLQGYLENSNVDPMNEMTSLMVTMRHFESMQKAALADDEMMQSAIQKIGDV